MVLERCVGIQMEDHFEENKLLQDFQFGFRRNKSCISELLTLFNELLRFKEQGKEIALLLFDLSAAFDTVDQSILISKLQIYGFDSTALNWVRSYLTDRTQQVIVSGELSTSSKTNRGTPQGSRISPLLFLILMADLNLSVKKGQLTNFADDIDTQLTTVEETEEKAKETTKEQADKIIEFFSNVQLKNNPDKAALIYNSKGKEKKIQMEVGGCVLETKASEKLLGLTVNSDLNWTTHVDKLCTTLKQRLGLLRRIKHKVNSNKLQIIAEAIFQSKIRYGISVYTIPKFEFNNLEQAMDPNIAKIQVIQNDMMRLLKGKSRKSHTNMEKLRKELKMMSVNQLSVYHVAIEMFNIINNKSSESLHEEMKLEPRGYNLRGLDDGKVKVPEKGKKSCNGFHYMGPKLWNFLPSHVRKTTIRNIFKEKLKDFIWESIPSV